ncbi:MAG: 7-carboxy-7-deazaguanine synthase [Desulfovibrio sp.]
MLFGGMQKLTALDFPGVVSALLFTQGCNFHCPYCHNAQLIPMEQAGAAVSEEDVLAFLEKRAGLLDGVVITGGEPCLQPDLEPFCHKIKNLGYKIKLDTNGSFPATVERLLAARLLDYAAVDVKTMPENYAPLVTVAETAATALAETFALLAHYALPYEVRTTCVAPFVDEAAIRGMAALVKPDVPWFFQRATIEPSSAQMRALPDDEIRCLLTGLAATHPLACLRG